jgi:3-phosphoshikimate 1-carboxyvinyltransferase
LIVPGSDITVENVMTNPTRSGLLATLVDMGADIEIAAERDAGGEPVADVRVRSSRLRGDEVPAERAPSMIDEYPVLGVAAAFAEGPTRMAGVAELKVKESDRLTATVRLLAAAGVEARAGADTLEVVGRGPGSVPGGADVATELDHRIAMSALVLGLAAKAPVAIDDGAPIRTSFTGFTETMRSLGADIALPAEAGR